MTPQRAESESFPREPEQSHTPFHTRRSTFCMFPYREVHFEPSTLSCSALSKAVDTSKVDLRV